MATILISLSWDDTSIVYSAGLTRKKAIIYAGSHTGVPMWQSGSVQLAYRLLEVS